MILGIRRPITLWESVAVLQIQQAYQCALSGTNLFGELLEAADLPTTELEVDKIIETDSAYRAIDSSAIPYAFVLAQLNGIDPAQITNPMLPKLQPTETGGIVLCPFGLKPDVDLPISVWSDIVRMLRSYGVPVTLVSDPGQRLDSAYFTEDAIVNGRSLTEKLKLLASAKLIVGCPNAYTWLATGMNKKQAVFYPSTMPNARWFGFYGHGHAYQLIGYDSHQVQIAILVASLRLAIEKF
jgi:hypothetical protein